MVDVKICGVTDESTLDAAIAARVRYLGFVFFAKSPRNIALERAAALAQRARGRALTVAVTVNADDALLAAIAKSVAPDLIQLHGGESPVRTAAARRYAQRGVIKALSVATAADLDEIDAFAPVSDLFLFDAKAPAGAAMPGGNGAAFDWPLLKGLKCPRPWFLSGGLSAENVARAIAESGTTAVDVSSGVESAPGVKDVGKILSFLAAAEAKTERNSSFS
jgi:phosphoribosylanthranilate isomerase